MYVLERCGMYVGRDNKNHPTAVMSKPKAITFKTETAANNYLKCLPDSLRKIKWAAVGDCDSEIIDMQEIKKFGNPTKITDLESDDFNICEFFTDVVNVMSQLERFIANMDSNQEITDMKILDVRHYIRDNNHKLNAIQMQRLGYYLQDLEKERYKYKSNKIIASMFVNNIGALKDKDSIEKMNDVVTSKYRPRVLDDNDIEYIINKKKDMVFIA